METNPGWETDALIVGGGPAGLAAAIALRQRGIACMVVEARSPGIDKACGEGLLPDSRAVLAALGVALDDTDGVPFRGIRFANRLHSVEAAFPAGPGLGVRRPHLHRRLAERAAVVGAEMLWNARVALPVEHADATSAVVTADGKARTIRFRWLIGADGEASTVRRWAGLDAVRRESLRFGFRTHYRIAPGEVLEDDCVEVHWGPRGQLYLTPVAEDCLCVVYLTRDRAGLREARTTFLADFPEIAARLADAPVASQQRGAVSATRRLRRVATDSVALIGDASGAADSITGEGLAICFRQAHALADSIAQGSLAPYARAHASIGRLPHAMGALMLTLDRWPGFQGRVLRAFDRSPALFGHLLDAHLGAASLPAAALRVGPRLAWNLVSDMAARPSMEPVVTATDGSAAW